MILRSVSILIVSREHKQTRESWKLAHKLDLLMFGEFM